MRNPKKPELVALIEAFERGELTQDESVSRHFGHSDYLRLVHACCHPSIRSAWNSMHEIADRKDLENKDSPKKRAFRALQALCESDAFQPAHVDQDDPHVKNMTISSDWPFDESRLIQAYHDLRAAFDRAYQNSLASGQGSDGSPCTVEHFWDFAEIPGAKVSKKVVYYFRKVIKNDPHILGSLLTRIPLSITSEAAISDDSPHLVQESEESAPKSKKRRRSSSKKTATKKSRTTKLPPGETPHGPSDAKQDQAQLLAQLVDQGKQRLELMKSVQTRTLLLTQLELVQRNLDTAKGAIKQVWESELQKIIAQLSSN